MTNAWTSRGLEPTFRQVEGLQDLCEASSHQRWALYIDSLYDSGTGSLNSTSLAEEDTLKVQTVTQKDVEEEITEICEIREEEDLYKFAIVTTPRAQVRNLKLLGSLEVDSLASAPTPLSPQSLCVSHISNNSEADRLSMSRQESSFPTKLRFQQATVIDQEECGRKLKLANSQHPASWILEKQKSQNVATGGNFGDWWLQDEKPQTRTNTKCLSQQTFNW